MKRLTLLLPLLLSLSALHAQTALYRAYVGKPGVQASCIANYPIGGDTTVAVTMLQASDPATFKALMKSLLSLPYKGDHTGQRNGDTGEFTKTLQQFPSTPSDSRKDIDHVGSPGSSATSKPSFNTFRTDPLPGDKGFYMIFHSSGTLTALVFHCESKDIASQITIHLIRKLKK